MWPVGKNHRPWELAGVEYTVGKCLASGSQNREGKPWVCTTSKKWEALLAWAFSLKNQNP